MSDEVENLEPELDDWGEPIKKENISLEVTKETKDKIVLSDEQKTILKEFWFSRSIPPPIYECVEKVFGKKYDARSIHGRAVKKALSEMDLKAPQDLPPKPKIELTESQKEYIVNNIKTMTRVEMAQELFNNPNLTNLSAETRVVIEYCKSLPSNIINSSYDSERGNDLNEYKPPSTLQQAFNRVNEYVDKGITQEQFKQNTKVQECLKSLIRFTHVYRYIHTMKELINSDERKLFESSFVRFVWDKPDLTEEEIDMYLNLCGDIVDLGRLKREQAMQTGWLEQQGETNDSDARKLSMTLVESIGAIRQDIDANQKRQVKLLENLQGKRSDRISNTIKSNSSILQLVEAWREEKTRKRLLKLSAQRKKLVKNEVNRIDTMDELTAQIFGLNQESFEP